MQYRLRTLFAIVTGCGVAFGLIRIAAYYPGSFFGVLFIAVLLAVYLVANIAFAYAIAWAISSFNWLIGRLQGKE